MKQFIADSAYFGVAVSLIGYEFGLLVRRAFKKSFLNPLLISVVFVMAALLILRVDYRAYYNSAKYISYLLTPATVALAVPLYEQLELLKKNWRAVLAGIASGTLASMTSIFLLCKLFSFTHEQYVTLLPKSIITAIGMGLSQELGGIVTITVASIIITGILGNVIAEFVFKLFRIRHPVARGLALGTASHAIGTSKAMELGQAEGAMSSLAIAVAGLLTVICASFFAQLM